MPIQQSPEQLANLLRELCKLPKETDWVEFKHNNDDPKLIGEYISVADADHGFPGIAFKPSTACHKQQKNVGWVSSIERNPTIEGQRVGLRLAPNPTYDNARPLRANANPFPADWPGDPCRNDESLHCSHNQPKAFAGEL